MYRIKPVKNTFPPLTPAVSMIETNNNHPYPSIEAGQYDACNTGHQRIDTIADYKKSNYILPPVFPAHYHAINHNGPDQAIVTSHCR